MRSDELMPPDHNGTILLAEDNPQDVELFELALKRAGYDMRVHAVSCGEEVIKYLKERKQKSTRSNFSLPRLVVLDGKIGGMSGSQVLAWMRQQLEFGSLPIIVLSGSEQESEREKAEALGANAYEIKPQKFEGLVVFVKKFCDFWLQRGL
jgi:CheY-like chemotaxis protein